MQSGALAIERSSIYICVGHANVVAPRDNRKGSAPPILFAQHCPQLAILYKFNQNIFVV